MSFESFFKLISYAVAVCGLICLFASGGIGLPASFLFLITVTAAWFLENTRWQLNEKLGIGLVFLFIPLFYFDWKYQITGFAVRENAAAGSLAGLILILAAIKLLQKKNDRDWIFIYVISFFEILLAAGLSISPLFILSFILYLLFGICAITALEIKKSHQNVRAKAHFSKPQIEFTKKNIYRLPVISTGILTVIAIFAIPLFFSLPRVGGAGFGKNSEGTSTGFSDSIKLGEIARVQQNNEVVMRVRIDEGDRDKVNNIKWRGLALDAFDGRSWKRTRTNSNDVFVKTDRDFFQVDNASDAKNLVVQNIYLEPLDTPVLFSLSRPVAIQGGFGLVTKDPEGAISVSRNGAERFSYRVFSDITQPAPEKLKADNVGYLQQQRRYLQLPNDTDPRIAELAQKIVSDAKAVNKYDKAAAIERYLQSQFGYTLDLKAGGEQPLADFLFNVREGHCEYFATAMAVMLRTQGIATRVVNGFQAGDYNQTADMFIVHQREAHAWVEVYFPGEKAWIAFDPTPASGQFSETSGMAGLFDKFGSYVEALETFWIQYVVSYDNQEQKSLVRSFKNGFQDWQSQLSEWGNGLRNRLNEWWTTARGDKGFVESAKAFGQAILYLAGAVLGILVLIYLYRLLARQTFWSKIKEYFFAKKKSSIVEFYERMQKVLAGKGFVREPHQTPLEFAFALNMPEAVSITEKYNRVRFGEKDLSSNESAEIENWLHLLENKFSEK